MTARDVAALACVLLSLAGCTGDQQPVAGRDAPAVIAGSAAATTVGTTQAAETSTSPNPAPAGVGPSRRAATGPTCDGGPAIPVEDEPDYPDWVFADGRHYFLQGAPGRPVTLGRVVVTTRCRLANSGTRRGYEPQQGDSTVLAPGVELFEVVGEDPAEVLATRTADGVELWRVEQG